MRIYPAESNKIIKGRTETLDSILPMILRKGRTETQNPYILKKREKGIGNEGKNRNPSPYMKLQREEQDNITLYKTVKGRIEYNPPCTKGRTGKHDPI